MITQGRRVYVEEGQHISDMLEPGDYGKARDGVWWCFPPETGIGIGRLTLHSITEHEDGTITVSPSILMGGAHDKKWHGFLERGVWRQA